MNEHLLQTIDSIDDIIEESEMNVCAALYDEYQKMAILLEYAEDDVVNEYEIVQEAFFMEAKKDTEDKTVKDKSSKKGNVILSGLKKLGGLIVRFFKMIGEKISKIWGSIKDGSKKLSNKFLNAVGEITGKNVRDDEKTYDEAVKKINKAYENATTHVYYDTTYLKNKVKEMKEILKDLNEWKNQLRFKSKKSENKQKEIVNKIDKCIEIIQKDKDELDNVLKQYTINSKTDKSFNDIITDYFSDFKETKNTILNTLSSITHDLSNLPIKGVGSKIDQEEFADLIEVLLEYFVGMHLANNHVFKASLQNVKIKSPIKDLNGMKNLSSIIGPIENVIFRDDNAYINYMKKIYNKSEQIMTIFNKDIGGYFTITMNDSKYVTSIKDIKFYHAWNSIPNKIYLNLTNIEINKTLSVSTSTEISKEIYKNKNKIDDIKYMFEDINSNSSKVELPASVKVYTKEALFNFSKHIYDNEKLTSPEKEMLCQRFQEEIYNPYYSYIALLATFYGSVHFGIREVYRIIHETHEEAFDAAEKNNVSYTDVFTLKDK